MTHYVRIVETTLPNGAVMLVRVREVDGGGATKVAWPDVFDFKGVQDALEGISKAVQSAVAAAKPDEVTVELGLELAVKSGKLTGLLVEGSGTGSLAVTLTWRGATP